MNKAFETVTAFIGDVTSLLKGLVVLGIVVGILFDDYFGVIAGIGGTQRMTKLIGRAKSMDMHLTGRMMGAEEAGLLALMLIVFWYKK